MSGPAAFTITTPQHVIDGILAKVRAYDWHEMPEIMPGEDRWAFGTDMVYLKELCAHWTQKYDWRAAETALNRFPQFKAAIDGLDIHFLHIEGSGANPETILLTHGWPGSIFEFYEIIEPLAHPEKFGGDAQDGVNLVIPSLPGFGFSAKPERPLGPRAVADLWDKLMREMLGYKTYIAQGGDWGSVISGWLAHHHSLAKGGGCKALHLNMWGLRPGGIAPETAAELKWADEMVRLFQTETAYLQLQMTKPQTLSYAMMDSPVGVAAWIVEKFNSWADTSSPQGAHIQNAVTKDQMLTNIMIYLTTRTFNTATWIYRGMADEGGLETPPGVTFDVPTAIARYPAEPYSFPPRSLVEKCCNIVRWNDFERGGHFAALETGQIFADDVREFTRQVKAL